LDRRILKGLIDKFQVGKGKQQCQVGQGNGVMILRYRKGNYRRRCNERPVLDLENVFIAFVDESKCLGKVFSKCFDGFHLLSTRVLKKRYSPLPNRLLNPCAASFAPAGLLIGVPFGYSSAMRSSQYVVGFGALHRRRKTSCGTCL